MRQLNIVVVILAVLATPIVAQATKVTFEDWSRDKPCGRRLADPVKAVIAGCEAAYCVNSANSSQVCSCLPSIDSDEARMTYKKNGKDILQWNTNIYPPSVASALRVDAADMNGDGKDELVIAALLTESNGMGIQHWNIWVVSDDKISNPVVVEDYGIIGFLSSNNRQCRLLVTRWIEGWEPKNEYGLYLTGMWFEFRDYKLQSTIYRPAIKRRYLNSLEKLRSQGFQNGKPVMWFRDPETSPIIGPYPFRD